MALNQDHWETENVDNKWFSIINTNSENTEIIGVLRKKHSVRDKDKHVINYITIKIKK